MYLFPAAEMGAPPRPGFGMEGLDKLQLDEAYRLYWYGAEVVTELSPSLGAGDWHCM